MVIKDVYPSTLALCILLTAALQPLTSFAATTATTLDYNKGYTSTHSRSATVQPLAFGSIYTTFLRLDQYNTAAEQAPITAIRWPGGSLADKQSGTYDLSFPDVYNEPAPGETGYNAATQKGLTDVMAYAVEKNIPLSIILPTTRYIKNVPQGQADVKAFLTKLLRGDYGPLPTSLTLEIGNESAHYGWSNGKFTPGVGSYGYLANAFITTINEVLASPTLNPQKRQINVGVQLSTTTGGQASVFSQISKTNIKTVDGFIDHVGLVDKASDFNFSYNNEKIKNAKKYWDTAWGRNSPEFKLLFNAWNIGGANTPSTNLDYTQFDIGARQAPAVVKVFAQMTGLGIDTADIWGIQDKISSLLFFKGEKITHGGHAFRLMAESLVGTQLLAGKVDSKGNWVSTGSNYDVFGYKGTNKAVIFLTAGDIPAEGLDVTITLANFGTIRAIATDAIKTISTGSGDVGTADDRLYEVPVVSTSTLTVSSGNKFTYKLTEDYEIVRFVVTK